MTTEKCWQTLCDSSDLIEQSGICALLDDEQQVALFKLNDQQVYALANWDPVGQANVLYRGIIGDDNGEVYVASPLYKQRFSLVDGRCLDAQGISVLTYPTRILNNKLQVQI